ncbi:hypothetical protein EFU26_07250 [Vibrio cholerae]|nr:hypothetical protein [Vibrio cholerae]
MKTEIVTPHPLAVLSAFSAQGMAILNAELTQLDDGWYQLLPAGAFKARDGRPTDTEDGHWHLDAEIAANMIAATKAASDKVLIDYDHQALTARHQNGPVPAAAWLNASNIEWREGKGLYVKPEFTQQAQTLITNKEYGFLSAVFPYDKQGRPLSLRMAALTNDPGVVGMEPLAKLAADFNLSFYTHDKSINGQTEDPLVNDLLKKLLGKLGVEVPDGGELSEAQSTAALDALDALKTKADKSGELETKVATLSAENTNLSQAYNGVTERIAVLSAQSQSSQVDTLINQAKAEGKIIEAEVAHLSSFGQTQGVAALSAMLEKRPAIAALSAQQTITTPPEKKNDDLSDEELAVLSACGLDKAAFLAAKGN